MDKIELHLELCDNEATDLQYKILANNCLQCCKELVMRIKTRANL